MPEDKFKSLKDDFLRTVEKFESQKQLVEVIRPKKKTDKDEKKAAHPSLILNQNLPIKYGIRKGLNQKYLVKDLNYEYLDEFGILTPDLKFKKVFGSRILFLDQLYLFKGKEDQKYLDRIKAYFHLYIIFVDFIGSKDTYWSNKTEFSNLVKILDSDWGIQVIPIHSTSDLVKILNPILENIQEKL